MRSTKGLQKMKDRELLVKKSDGKSKRTCDKCFAKKEERFFFENRSSCKSCNKRIGLNR